MTIISPTATSEEQEWIDTVIPLDMNEDPFRYEVATPQPQFDEPFVAQEEWSEWIDAVVPLHDDRTVKLLDATSAAAVPDEEWQEWLTYVVPSKADDYLDFTDSRLLTEDDDPHHPDDYFGWIARSSVTALASQFAEESQQWCDSLPLDGGTDPYESEGFVLSPAERERHVSQDRRFFASTELGWDDSGIKSMKCVGNLIDTIRRLDPSTPDEWQRRYFAEARNLSVLRHEVKAFARRARIEHQQAMTFMLYRLLDQTYAGHLSEAALVALLRRLYPNARVRYATLVEDRQMAVDVVVEMPDGRVFGFQLKPDSFFMMSPGKGTKRQYEVRTDRWRSVHGTEVVWVSTTDVMRGVLRPILPVFYKQMTVQSVRSCDCGSPSCLMTAPPLPASPA